jgi:hypothetical protein
MCRPDVHHSRTLVLLQAYRQLLLPHHFLPQAAVVHQQAGFGTLFSCTSTNQVYGPLSQSTL